MIKKEPISRHNALKPISREHHNGLLFCWKLRTGFKNGVEIQRLKAYADWFFSTYLVPHFQIEEEQLFPILGNNHKLIKRALAEHRRLTRLFSDTENTVKSLSLIEEELDAHIRFEERVLFSEIEKEATENQLAELEKLPDTGTQESGWQDAFWEKKQA